MGLVIAVYHSAANPQRGRCEPRLRVVFGQVRAGRSADRRCRLEAECELARWMVLRAGSMMWWNGQRVAGCLPGVAVRDRSMARDNVIGRFRLPGGALEAAVTTAEWGSRGLKKEQSGKHACLLLYNWRQKKTTTARVLTNDIGWGQTEGGRGQVVSHELARHLGHGLII